jgi:hypothetical protein
MIRFAALMLLTATAAPASPPAPLFASDEPIHLAIRGPIGSIARDAEENTEPRAATVELVGQGAATPIRLSARGIARRRSENCTFPPLRIDLGAGASGLLAGQNRLKLVTHCRDNRDFEQHVLLEYSAYRIYNVITPLSFRARLATVDYYDGSSQQPKSHLGFLLESQGDLARRNGLSEARVGTAIPVATLEPMQAARAALFEYMIGNLDWAMQAAPAGEDCCHNIKLLADAARPGVNIPVPYDFDYSGLDNRPYATPPDIYEMKNVRQRRYHGFCFHHREALAAAAEFRSKRTAIDAVFATIPGMTDKSRQSALSYLAGFWADIATDQGVERLLADCVS